MNENQANRSIPKTKEEKDAAKALKVLEKQKRQLKALQKLSNNNDENTLIKSLEKVSVEPVSDNIIYTRVKRPSDMVIFNETSVKSVENKSTKQIQVDQKSFSRLQEVKRASYFKNVYYPDRRDNLGKKIDQITELSIFPELKKFALDIDSFLIRGSILRTYKFLEVMKQVTLNLPALSNEYFSETFTKTLETCADVIGKCRPLPIPTRTAINYLKLNLSMLRESDAEKSRQLIVEMIDQFLTERIDVAHRSIENFSTEFIKPGQQVLVFGHSQIVLKSIIRAWTEFQARSIQNPIFVVIVDSFPGSQARIVADKLSHHSIPHLITGIAAVPRLLTRIDLVLLGAASVLSSGHVDAPSGSASIASAAHALHKPVVVCAETCKFSSQSGGPEGAASALNELGNPDILVEAVLCDETAANNDDVSVATNLRRWRDHTSSVTVLDVLSDIIPGRFVTAVCCEFGLVAPAAVAYVATIKQPN